MRVFGRWLMVAGVGQMVDDGTYRQRNEIHDFWGSQPLLYAIRYVEMNRGFSTTMEW